MKTETNTTQENKLPQFNSAEFKSNMNPPINLNVLSVEELEAALAARKQLDFENEEKRKSELVTAENLLVNSIVDEYAQQSENLKALKELQAESIIQHNKKLHESLGKEPKEAKQITLSTDNGKRKVELVYSDQLGFNSEAPIHIEAIKDILKEKFKDVEAGYYDFLDGILIKNTKGDYDPRLLTKARQKASKLQNSAALLEEFDKLEKCRIVVGKSR